MLRGWTWFLVMAGLPAAASGAEWSAATTGAFTASRCVVFLPDTGRPCPALELRYPGHSTSTPGEYGQWSAQVVLPAGEARLRFLCADDFLGPTAGYHFLQVRLEDEVVWEEDVAGGDMELKLVQIPLPARGKAHHLAFRLQEKKQVTNFAVRVRIANPVIVSGDQSMSLLPQEADVSEYRELPPDLPLPSLPLIGDWTWQASIIQPWGQTQTVAIRQAAEWSRRFAREHGFNAIIMLPPAAHNAITAGDITEDEFRAALAAYRREGMKFILYTSVMHSGHDPAWQFGEIAKAHPEWTMRDAVGGTINEYGNPWLCPSTGALEYTLQYTARLVRDYDADAVMLDNNEFLHSVNGRPTCYCEACQRKFRQYVRARLGERGLQETFGLGPEQVAIPEAETEPLWGLWLAWRNRVWAEACETFRRELRGVKPDVAVTANTQYLYPTYMLAVDGQYTHLDAFLSESRGHRGADMAAKMVLGRALAVGRPLWNYIGTFDEGDFTKLRPPEEVAAVCAASEAFGANPWIVFYGFLGQENQAALAVIRQYTDFWRDNADLLGASRLRGDVALLFSTESRDLANTPLLSPLLAGLIGQGLAVCGLRDAETLTPARLEGVKVLVAARNECLRADTARRLAEWVRGGGELIITPATGWRDEYGRWRPASALTAALGENVSALGEHPLGTGRVLSVASEAEAGARVAAAAISRVQSDNAVGVCWSEARDGRQVLAVVGFDAPVGAVTLRLPAGVQRAELRVPDEAPRRLEVGGTPDQPTVHCVVGGRLGLVVGEVSR